MKDPLKRNLSTSSSNDSAITLEDENGKILKNSAECNQNVEFKLNNLAKNFTELVFNFTCLALEDESIMNKYRLSEIIQIIRPYFNFELKLCKPLNENLILDRFGFNCKELNEKEIYLQFVLSELLDMKCRNAWDFGSYHNLKLLVRQFGIPNELRPKIWLSFIMNKVSNIYNIENLLDLAENTIELFESGNDVPNIRQIDLDIFRTMPNHIMFSEENSKGLQKLRKILVAYAEHVNPNVGYCQAMNFLAALLLIIFNGNQQHALMGLICIIDNYFPSNYFDENLTGARADQMLLRELILQRLSTKIKHKDQEQFNIKLELYSKKIDEITGSLSLNWFLSLYHNAVPWQTRLYILDCFWIEGIEVLFRFGLALLPLKDKLNYLNTEEEESRIGDLINQMKDECAKCHDVDLLKSIAFNQMHIPNQQELLVKRAFYVNQITIKLNELKQKKLKENESSKHIELDAEEKNEIFHLSNVQRSLSTNGVVNSSNQSFKWLRKRLSLSSFYFSPNSYLTDVQNNSFYSLDGIRSCESASQNGEHLVQMVLNPDYPSKIILELRNTHYSNIFYPNRRSSIVLSDSEQHSNAIKRLKNLYNKELYLVGCSNDGKWLILVEIKSRRLNSNYLQDNGVNVIILSVPFSIKSWHFDEYSWQVFLLDTKNLLWQCNLADPFKLSKYISFFDQNSNKNKDKQEIKLISYDHNYQFIWVYVTIKNKSTNQDKLNVKQNINNINLDEQNLDQSSSGEENDLDEELFCSNLELENKYYRLNKFIRKDNQNIDKTRNEYLDRKIDEQIVEQSNENIEEKTDENLNDENQHNKNNNQFDQSTTSSDDNLEAHDCDELNLANNALKNFRTNRAQSVPTADHLLLRKVSSSTIFRRSSLMLSNANKYVLDKSLKSTYLDEKSCLDKENSDCEFTVKNAVNYRMHIHSMHSKISSKKQLKRLEKNEEKMKNESINHQLYVIDASNLNLFGILRLNVLDVEMKKIFCLGGLAYCGFEDGSIAAITIHVARNLEQPCYKRLLLQAQPDDELIDLHVFNVSNEMEIDKLTKNLLDEFDSNSSSELSPSSDVNEEDELIHYDAVVLSNITSQSNQMRKKQFHLQNTFHNSSSTLGTSSNLSQSSGSTKSCNSIEINLTNEINLKNKIKNLNTDGSQNNLLEKIPERIKLNQKLNPTKKRNLDFLPVVFNHSVNKSILVLALYSSGKLHCIYTKYGCVQERKLFRLDKQTLTELPIKRLRIVNAFRMNWDHNETNLNECNSNSTNCYKEYKQLDQLDQSNELLNNNLLDENKNLSNTLNEQRRKSLNLNECNYLVTLWCPHPVNRLIKFKL